MPVTSSSDLLTKSCRVPPLLRKPTSDISVSEDPLGRSKCEPESEYIHYASRGNIEGSPQCEYTHRAKNTNNITQTLAVIIEKSSTFPEIPEEIC